MMATNGKEEHGVNGTGTNNVNKSVGANEVAAPHTKQNGTTEVAAAHTKQNGTTEVDAPHTKQNGTTEVAAPHAKQNGTTEVAAPHTKQNEVAAPHAKQNGTTEVAAPHTKQNEVAAPHTKQNEVAAPHTKQNGTTEVAAPHTKQNGAERFTFSASPTVEDIRRMQAQFTDERDWNQFHQPRNLLLALVGEVGEVSELFQWRGEVAEGLPDWTDGEREHLAHELSDVLIYLVELAEKCRVDLPRAVLRKMELNRLKYPASKVHGSAKKYTEYED